jgi:HAD superfamily hydrolase (TIGR01509 family)
MFLDRFELHELVDIVITAADVQQAKPAPEGLFVIAEALGVAPSQLLMVGDSTADRDAARGAGARFVSVGHTTRAAVGADASVTHVAELRAG